MSSQSMAITPMRANLDGAGRLPSTQRPEATLVLLPAGQHGISHTAAGHGVVLLVITGSGTLSTGRGPQSLSAGVVVRLTAGPGRAVVAGERGLAYVTVRR
jgi:quercetin dioxygenase-like cupin family protein